VCVVSCFGVKALIEEDELVAKKSRSGLFLGCFFGLGFDLFVG
jgi:hypothetical protein